MLGSIRTFLRSLVGSSALLSLEPDLQKAKSAADQADADADALGQALEVARLGLRTAEQAFEVDGSQESENNVLAARGAVDRATLRAERAARVREKARSEHAQAEQAFARATLRARLQDLAGLQDEARAAALELAETFERAAEELGAATQREADARAELAAHAAQLPALEGKELEALPELAGAVSFDALRAEVDPDVCTLVAAHRVIRVLEARIAAAVDYQRAAALRAGAVAVPKAFASVLMKHAVWCDLSAEERGEEGAHAGDMLRALERYSVTYRPHVSSLERVEAYLRYPCSEADRLLDERDARRAGRPAEASAPAPSSLAFTGRAPSAPSTGSSGSSFTF
jgi:hypothetical protein